MFACSFFSQAFSNGPLPVQSPSNTAQEETEFFEKQIRPLLIERCHGCHGEKKQWAGLRLDSRDAILSGGDSGPSIVLGDDQRGELLE
jgi:hypothetical protein